MKAKDEVEEILSMFASVHPYIPEGNESLSRALTFQGFDVNDSRQDAHNRAYKTEIDRNAFEPLKLPKSLPSHSRASLDIYRRMLPVYRELIASLKDGEVWSTDMLEELANSRAFTRDS